MSKKWLIAGAIVLVSSCPIIFVCASLILSVLLGGTSSSVISGSYPVPKDVDPAKGIPEIYLPMVVKASQTYSVPMQYLAGEVMVESGWDPNAYADYSGSHAMGMMQFQPETWSGYLDPYMDIATPDTDLTRITQYGGYGKNGDGMFAPVNTPARVSNLAELNSACQSQGNVGCAPYASPFDPADALMAGASYLAANYHIDNSWAAASAQYYGGSGQEDYVKKVFLSTYAYIADTSPIQRGDGTYWPFGNAKLVQTSASDGYLISGNDLFQQDSPATQFLSSLPLVAPVSGTVTWTTDHLGIRIQLPMPGGETMTIHTTNKGAIKWLIDKNQSAFQATAGDVIGFVDAQNGFRVSESLISAYPDLPNGVFIDPSKIGVPVLEKGR